MKIDISREQDSSTIYVDGNMKNLENTQNLIDIIENIIKDANQIYLKINIKNSLTVTSTFIGFLIHKINFNNIDLNIGVYDDRLYDLFDMLELIETFNVEKII